MNWKISVLSDGAECVPYEQPEFRVYAGKNWISEHYDMHVLCHWHDDLEFAFMLQGKMTYSINDEVIELQAGEGIFINSRQLHSNYSADGTDGQYLCVLIHPSVLCANSLTAERAVEPLLKNTSFPWCKLTEEYSWQSGILQAVRQIMECSRRKEPSSMLAVQAQAFIIAELLFSNMPEDSASLPYVDRRRTALRNMVSFIHRHFAEKIALKDIAAAGNVSITTCHDIFRRHLRQTPLEYLTRYRLNRAAAYLRESELSITEISLACGFSGSSYFAECFRREMGMSPGEYRRGT